MSAVVIAYASSAAEIGAVAHLTAEPATLAAGSANPISVWRTVCGKPIIGRLFDRDGPTCALCLAVSGQHPGPSGKRWLTRQHRAGGL